MYYLLLLLLFIVLYTVFVKILGSLIKGCLMAFGIVLIVYTIYIMVNSIKQPMNIFGLYEVDNFNVRKLY
jgi:hypothetical protein